MDKCPSCGASVLRWLRYEWIGEVHDCPSCGKALMVILAGSGGRSDRATGAAWVGVRLARPKEVRDAAG